MNDLLCLWVLALFHMTQGSRLVNQTDANIEGLRYLGIIVPRFEEDLPIKRNEVKDLVELDHCNLTGSKGYINVNDFEQIYSLTHQVECEYNGFVENSSVNFKVNEIYQVKSSVPDPSADSFLKYERPTNISKREIMNIFAKTNLKFELDKGYEYFMVNEKSLLGVRVPSGYWMRYCNNCDCHLVTDQTALVKEMKQKGIKSFHFNLIKKDNTTSIISKEIKVGHYDIYRDEGTFVLSGPGFKREADCYQIQLETCKLHNITWESITFQPPKCQITIDVDNEGKPPCYFLISHHNFVIRTSLHCYRGAQGCVPRPLYWTYIKERAEPEREGVEHVVLVGGIVIEVQREYLGVLHAFVTKRLFRKSVRQILYMGRQVSNRSITLKRDLTVQNCYTVVNVIKASNASVHFKPYLDHKYSEHRFGNNIFVFRTPWMVKTTIKVVGAKEYDVYVLAHSRLELKWKLVHEVGQEHHVLNLQLNATYFLKVSIIAHRDFHQLYLQCKTLNGSDVEMEQTRVAGGFRIKIKVAATFYCCVLFARSGKLYTRYYDQVLISTNKRFEMHRKSRLIYTDYKGRPESKFIKYYTPDDQEAPTLAVTNTHNYWMGVENNEIEVHLPAKPLENSVTVLRLNTSDVIIPLYIVHSRKNDRRDPVRFHFMRRQGANDIRKWFAKTENDKKNRHEVRRYVGSHASVCFCLAACPLLCVSLASLFNAYL